MNDTNDNNYMVLYIDVDSGELVEVYEDTGLSSLPRAQEIRIIDEFKKGAPPEVISTKAYDTLFAAWSPG